MKVAEFIGKHIGSGFALLVLLSLSLGCICSSNSGNNCVARVKANGKTFVGKAAKKGRADLNACNKFCLETDSEFDGMYQIWLDSASGRRLRKVKKRLPTKEEAIYEDKRLLDYVTKNCATRCVREANKGKHTLKSSCKK